MNNSSYLRAGVLALGLLASTSASQAAASPPARWCLNESGYTTGECVYSTLEQCLQDRSGEGGYCSPNPAGPPLSR